MMLSACADSDVFFASRKESCEPHDVRFFVLHASKKCPVTSGHPIVQSAIYHLQGDSGTFHAEQSEANSRSEYHSVIGRNITLPKGRISLLLLQKYH